MAQSAVTRTLASQVAGLAGDSAEVGASSDRVESFKVVHVGHTAWVRLSHWLAAASVLMLAVSGFVILMAHPRLYWGSVGNDLTPALIELPVSRNYQHGGWDKRIAFYAQTSSPVSASRTYDIFNQNSWGRSLHFLAAWLLAATGAFYLLAGFFSGHFRRHLLPAAGERSGRKVWEDFISHARFKFPPTTGGPPYGILQKWSYAGVVFVALPIMIVTGLAMSPAMTVAYPFLSAIFGGSQSARTIHFIVFAALLLFLIIHVVMVVLSGFGRQIRAMTWGN